MVIADYSSAQLCGINKVKITPFMFTNYNSFISSQSIYHRFSKATAVHYRPIGTGTPLPTHEKTVQKVMYYGFLHQLHVAKSKDLLFSSKLIERAFVRGIGRWQSLEISLRPLSMFFSSFMAPHISLFITDPKIFRWPLLSKRAAPMAPWQPCM